MLLHKGPIWKGKVVMKRIRPSFITQCGFLPRPPWLSSSSSTKVLATKRRFTAQATLRPNVTVVGGGFGGISTALQLAALPWTRLTRPNITLIDRCDRFVFLPMLYELATNAVESWEVAPLFADVLQDTPIRYVQAQVDSINLESGHIEGVTNDVNPLSEPFDRAVIALGAECANLGLVPGAKEHALPFYSLQHATTVRERVRGMLEDKSAADAINVVVVGGGFSGVEIASTLAEFLGTRGSVVIVERSDTLLKAAAPHNRSVARRALDERGVMIELRTSVSRVNSDCIALQKIGDDVVNERPTDLVLWTAGSRPSANLSGLGLTLDEYGRIETDEYLQVAGLADRIFALGDAAVVPNQVYGGTAQVAAQQAEYAAWNCWASLTDRSKLRYRYAHLGEMMVFGAKDASVASPIGLEVDGVSAFFLRRAAYLARMPTDRHRMRVAASWAADPLLRGIKFAASEARRQGGVL